LGEAFTGEEKQAAILSGERGCCQRSGQRAQVAGLLVGVLDGLGGALQEDQQPANFLAYLLKGAVKLHRAFAHLRDAGQIPLTIASAH
jgi:hypothetical protein